MFALLRAFWRVNLAEEMQYRANLIASLLGTLFWMATAILTVAVFFRQTGDLGGWSFWQVVALLGVYNALGGVIEAVLRPGIGRLVADIRTGALDLILVKPTDAQFYVSFRRLNIWRVADIGIGFTLTGIALAQLGSRPSAAPLIAFALTFLAAAAVIYSVWIALMSLAFWFVQVENLSLLFDAVFEAARYPASAYPGALRLLFVYLIPIAWTTTIPASAITGRLGPGLAIGAVAVGIACLLITRLFWRVALRRYTSAGG